MNVPTTVPSHAALTCRLDRPIRYRPSLGVLAMVCTLAWPFGAQAQRLHELVEAARSYDANYQGLLAAAEAAKHRAEQARALLRPSLALTGAASYGRTDTPLTRNIGGVRSAQGALAGRYPLYNASSKANIDQATKALDLNQHELAAAEQDLILRVSQAYFDVLAAQDALATVRASKVAITEQLASARRNFEVGTATITDTREAQARFDLVTAQELAGDNDLRVKRLALEQLAGRSNVQPKALQTPVQWPAVTPDSAEAWVTLADTQHPSLQRLLVANEVARLETAKARAAERPTLDAVANLSQSITHGTALPAIQRGTTTTGTVGVQMNWPLFTGGATQSRIQETLALEERASQDLLAARRSIGQGTRAAFFGVQSLAGQVKALEAAEASSKLALEATQLGYKVGVRVNLDVLNAQTQLFQAQRDLARARYDLLVSGLRLRQVAGVLTPADTQAVDRVLAR